MRRILTLTLTVHWMCVFAMLGIVCTIDPRDGFAAPLHLLGVDTRGIEQDGGSEAAAFFTVVFLLVAVLFLMTAADLVLGGSARAKRRPHFARAVGAGVLALTLLLLAGALQQVPSLFCTVEVVLAAALASYLVMRAEPLARRTGERDTTAVARLMALGAAHASLLARFSRRPPSDVLPRII